MDAIVIRVRLDSTTLVLPELEPLVGKSVEIRISDESATPPRRFSSSPTATSVLLEEALVESGVLSRLA